MMKARSVFHLCFALLLASFVLSSGCAKRQLTRVEADRLETLEAKIAQAEAAGALECAPRELARAKVAVEHARHESSESIEDFNTAFAEAEKAVEALLEKMKDCKRAVPGTEPGTPAASPASPDGKPVSPAGKPPASSTPSAAQSEPPVPSGDAVQPAPFRPAPVPSIQKDEGSFENIYFDFDESVVREDAKPILLIVASYLKNNPKFKLIVEGHCDERGTSEYNMALGQRRADATRTYLVNLGIPVSRITTVSYGKERPLLPGHDDEAWSKNRRAVFVLKP